MNIHILMDYDNVYITLEKNYVTFENPNLRKDIVTKINDKFCNDSACETKLFMDFGKIKLNEDEFLYFKNNHIKLEHVYSGKNASDIYLIIDIMNTLAIDNDIDGFVIISSDSDMLPIVNELKRRRKYVAIGYFEVNSDDKYIEYLNTITDEVFSIEKLFGLIKFVPNNINKFDELDYVKKLLPQIDMIIDETYKQYLKTDSTGKILQAGTLNKGAFRDKLIQYKIFPAEDFKGGFVIQSLLDKGIIYEYVTPVGYNTLLISPQYIIGNAIDFSITIKEENFNFQY